ncbi:hypothetical protein BJA01nite_40830 [Bradyrhizobium japonicum]|nr:hypothetical protein BJ6T_14280 [Bradyrhizobium japonicum USDA 6]GEC46441.1 hypothetical protein BJA01nite_40830 [Bradyrhizobium japonicum]
MRITEYPIEPVVRPAFPKSISDCFGKGSIDQEGIPSLFASKRSRLVRAALEPWSLQFRDIAVSKKFLCVGPTVGRHPPMQAGDMDRLRLPQGLAWKFAAHLL